MKGSEQKPVIVVEAGKDYVKLIQVLFPHRKPQVSKVFFQQFDTVDYELTRRFAASLRMEKLAKGRVIACLPRQAVNVRLLEVPSTDPSEISDMVELQVGKQTPYSRDEIVADYRILGSGREGYTRIMLVIVQRILMRQRFQLLESAGLDVESMSVSTEGVLNWYRAAGAAAGGEEPALVLDIDSTYTDFTVMRAGDLLFTKTIRIGARQLLEDRSAWSGKFILEVERAVEAYRGEVDGNVAPRSILLTGAGPQIEGLGADLGDRFKVVVKALDSMQNVGRSASLPDVTKGDLQVVSLTALVGIALSQDSLEFKLVPESVSIRRGLAIKAKVLTHMAALLIAGIVSASSATTVRMYHRVAYLACLKKAVEQTKEEATVLEKMGETTRMTLARLDSSRSPLNLLLELHALTPPEIFYDVITIGPGRQIGLKGQASEYSYVTALRSALEASKVISGSVRAGNQARLPSGMVGFDLTCRPSELGEGE